MEKKMKSLQNRKLSEETKVVTVRPITEATKKAFALSILRGLLTDVKRLRPGYKGLDRDLITLEARIEHEGVAFLGTNLCNLGKALDKGLSTGTFTCPTGFATRKDSKLPRLFGGIFCEVFDDSTGIIKECDLMEDVKILRQLLFFLEKVLTGLSSINYAREEDEKGLSSDGFTYPSNWGEYIESHQPDLPFGSNKS